VSGVNVTRDQILDGMVTALASVTAGVGNPVSSTRFLYSTQRYMGTDFAVQEVQERGVAGRGIACRVAFIDERTIRTTIGRRRDYVEGTYGVYLGVDIQRSRDSRKTLFAAMDNVRLLLGARAFALGVKPLRYKSTARKIDDDKLLLYLDTYTTRYRVDYTKTATYDTMLDVVGEVYEGTEEAPVNPTGLHVVFP
jgi:hypothetical protein